MKNNILKSCALFVSICTVGGLAASITSCTREGGRGEKIDSSRTQIYVKNFQGGYGNKWLYAGKAKYEELHAKDSYESGKTGVQIIIADQKNTPTFDEIKSKNGTSELYFFESINYLNGVNQNAFEDITDLVVGDNPYEPGKNIEDKMYDSQKDFLNIKDKSGNPHYYAIPHYICNFGIIYNKSVFKNKLLYFADDYKNYEPGSEFRFIETSSSPKSVGIDGIAGTYDDGLPTTYDEFYELCNYIKGAGTIPLVWMGKNGGGDYFGWLLHSLSAFYDGAASEAVNYTFDGDVKVCQLNNATQDVVLDGNGHVVSETKTIHPQKVDGQYDGAEVMRSVGKYYGLSFVDRIMDESFNSNGSHKNNWECNLISNSSTQLDAQNYFINSQFGRLNALDWQRNQSIAMLLDGNWWESEASEVIASLPDNEKAQLDFGWMPLPMADENSNTKQVILPTESYVFMKKGLSQAKRDLIGDFIQFMNTDEALQEFTTITNAVKSFKYSMNDENLAKMSNFGRDFWNYVQGADYVLPQSRVDQFINTYGTTLSTRIYTYGGNFWCQDNFRADANLTAGKYVYKMYDYYKEVFKNAK